MAYSKNNIQINKPSQKTTMLQIQIPNPCDDRPPAGGGGVPQNPDNI